MTSQRKTGTPSDMVSRHDQLVEAYAQFRTLLAELGYELRADDWEGFISLDIHARPGDRLFTIDLIERQHDDD